MWIRYRRSSRLRGHLMPRMRVRRGRFCWCTVTGVRIGRLPAGRRIRGLLWAHGIHVMPHSPCPMSAIVSIGLASSRAPPLAGPHARPTPAAKPVRSMDCAKIVNTSWPEGSTMTS